MNKFRIILYIIISCFCLSANAQLKFDTIYKNDYLREQLSKAVAEKDSASLGMAAALLSGNLKWKNNTTSEGVDLLMLSIKCFAAIGDSAKYYHVRPLLIDNYVNSNLYEEAEKILLECFSYHNRKQNLSKKVHIASRLGYLYTKMGETAKSIQFKEECHNINKIVKDTLLDILYFIDKATFYRQQKKWGTGISYARKSLMLSRASKYNNFTGLSLFYIGILNQYNRKLDTAIVYFKDAEMLRRHISFSKLRKDCYRHLSQCYKYKKDYKNAYHYAIKYSSLNDSILHEKRVEVLDELTLKFDAKEKISKISLLEKEKKLEEEANSQKLLLLYALSIGLALLFVLLWFLVRFYRAKIESDTIIEAQNKKFHQHKIKSLEDDLQIKMIKSMLDGQEKERSRIAIDLHDSLGGMLSVTKLQIEDKNFIAHDLLDKLAAEVRNIAQNLQPSALQKLGFIPAIMDLIDFYQIRKENPIITFQHFNIPQNLDKQIALHFYRFIQEALQNTIKHAKASEILIQINGEINGISILVEDNGKGFDTSKKYLGNGLVNIQKRAEFLKAELNVESGKTGTSLFLLWQS